MDLENTTGCRNNTSLWPLLFLQVLINQNVCFHSFHVGSGVEEAAAFSCAVKQAYDAFTMAQNFGFEMTLLDIGGGFPGQKSAPVAFEEVF